MVGREGEEEKRNWRQKKGKRGYERKIARLADGGKGDGGAGDMVFGDGYIDEMRMMVMIIQR